MYGVAIALYAACLLLALIGLITLIIPLVGIFFLGLAFVCYIGATFVRRKARELDVRRQQGS